MALDQVANFVVDALQSSINDTATSLSVADASQFPDPSNGSYNCVVFDATRPSKDPDVEVVRVTGRDTTNDTLTVSRGQENTSATSHAADADVSLSYTARFRDDIQSELDDRLSSSDDVESLSTSGADNTVPTSDGSGNLSMKELPSGGNNVIVTDPSDNEPAVGNRGDLWYPTVAQGSKRWSYETGERFGGGIAVSDGIVYTGEYTLSEPKFYAVDTTDGTLVWSYPVPTQQKSGVAVSNQTVYFGDDDGILHAVNAVDGTERWTYANNTSTIRSGITVRENTVYFGSYGNNIHAVNASDGSEKWTYSVGDYVISDVVFSNGVVYAGSADNSLYAVNADDGTKAWSYEAGNTFVGGVAVSDSTVYAANNNGTLYALNASDGSESWTYSTSSVLRSGIAVSNDAVYFGDYNSIIYSLDKSDGSENWTFNAEAAEIEVDVIHNNNTLYTGGPYGPFYALDASDGTEVWRYPADKLQKVRSGPVFSDDIVYFSGDDLDGIIALHAEDLYQTPRVSDGTNWLQKR